jgi:LPXTG-motif cell wall-anchored protein
MTKIFRLVGAAAFALLAVFAVAGPASAQTYPNGDCAASVAAGVIDLDCSGFLPGTEVNVTLDGEVLGSGLVRPDGTVALDANLPAECGTYNLAVSGGGVTRTTQVTVPCAPGAAPGAVTPAGTLPYTGSDSAPIAQIGVALLAAGALVTFAVRQRGKAQA